MAFQNHRVEVQVKLIELAWDAAQKAASVTSYSTTQEVSKEYVERFGHALDGFVRSCESAGTGQAAE
jgi:hypothetical protein